LTRKQLKRSIRECEAEIENIKSLPYYSIFKRDAEQEADLRELYHKLEELQSQLAITVFSPSHAELIEAPV
jgi:hypothetical protein